MEKITKANRSQSVQFLFTMLLFLILSLSAVLTISFGSKVYENVGVRMNENFYSTTSLSYISNKIRQSDEMGAISVIQREGTQVLRIQQQINGEIYETLIYHHDGSIKELFYSQGTELVLSDGIPIMENEGIRFEMKEKNMLLVETMGKNPDSILLTLRSEGY